MKLDCVLTAVNNNPLYLEFIPIFVNTWKKLYPSVDVKIILTAEKIPEEYLDYKENIILFEPIENVLTSFIAQYIRLLYPCILNYENGILITDMDILPMNRTYYTEHIKEYENTKFIYMRENICFSESQIAMCYNVASPLIWKEIFEINSLEDVRDRLKTVFQSNIVLEGGGNVGWCIDQLHLYEKVINWNDKTNNFICLKEKDTGFHRLNRFDFYQLDDIIKENISNGVYADYHCYRPMSTYHKINNDIYDLLPAMPKEVQSPQLISKKRRGKRRKK
uniref:Nucleotide-diphospho-sugar transferase domain-containing protein n=2 Tax=viral metagenome TaxID=1070528 RepID=A0A6C0CUP4_9ZZZZ